MGDPEMDKNEGTVAETDETVPVEEALEANSFTDPDAFLKYNFSSAVLIASSPEFKSTAAGAAAGVVL